MSRRLIVERLRLATNDAHHRLEADLDVIATLSSDHGRRRLVGRYYTLYAGADAAIAPWLARLGDMAAHGQARLRLLEDDMRRLGEPATQSLRPPPRPEIASRGEALGLLYVVEGSALGGRVILRALRERGCTTEGLSFLDPHGRHAGAAWNAILDGLEACLSGDDAGLAAAEAGAVRGFDYARACLCESGPPAFVAPP